MIGSLIVIAKEPIAGRVKTRLVPPLTHRQAADVAAAALADTLHAAAAVPATKHVVALDGVAGAWLPQRWQVVAQCFGGLDVRLAAAFAAAGPGPSVLVGMDTPQLTAAHLDAVDLSAFDACLGPSTDGGYWAIGFRDPLAAAAVVPGVPMSTERTAAEQLRRMRDAGLRVQILDELTDVDTIDTAHEVARQCPHTRFAHVLARATSGAGRDIVRAGR